jgi:hypothetical protein
MRYWRTGDPPGWEGTTGTPLPRRREVAGIFLWLVPEKTCVPDVELPNAEQERYNDKSNFEHW